MAPDRAVEELQRLRVPLVGQEPARALHRAIVGDGEAIALVARFGGGETLLGLGPRALVAGQGGQAQVRAGGPFSFRRRGDRLLVMRPRRRGGGGLLARLARPVLRPGVGGRGLGVGEDFLLVR
jgi:hypothetical protein